LLSTIMTATWQLWLFWGVSIGLGTGMTALVLGATVANRWFVQRRGLVMGILTAANATGQLAFLPLAAWLAPTYGWPVALAPCVAGSTAAATLMILFGRDHPSAVGLPAFGERAVAPPAPPVGNATRNAMTALGDASGSRVFWVLFATFFVCGLSTNGLI